ncbi:hypothetical protein EMCG_06482 [[Emmonsia] crescens]|uniref:Uncharacterized protein n=1 Tax=[Emmonsia] crescens TaxID=73230 RepID=A0A0G2IBF5_9EURO|nr:hypothetical protein EMCG_06482 [Emmonsia crescens UAMH 3008]
MEGWKSIEASLRRLAVEGANQLRRGDLMNGAAGGRAGVGDVLDSSGERGVGRNLAGAGS